MYPSAEQRPVIARYFGSVHFPKFKSRKRGGSLIVPQFCYLEDGYVIKDKLRK